MSFDLPRLAYARLGVRVGLLLDPDQARPEFKLKMLNMIKATIDNNCGECVGELSPTH